MSNVNCVAYEYTTELYGYLDSFPIGNGQFGAFVYGKPIVDKLSFNHDTVWSGVPKTYRNGSAFEAYSKAQAAIERDDFAAAEDALMQDFHGDWSQMYLPMCNLYAVCPKGRISDYQRMLDMEHGVMTVEYDQNQIHFNRTYFASRSKNLVAFEYCSSAPVSYEFFTDSKLRFETEILGNLLILKGECPSHMYPASHIEGDSITYGGGIRFTTAFRFETDGVAEAGNGHMQIRNCTQVRIFVCCETSFRDWKSIPDKECYRSCLDRAVAPVDFHNLLDAHKTYFSSIYGRTDFQCGREVTPKNVKKWLSSDQDLVEKTVMYFNFAKYLLISSSEKGTMPTNLQGIWNEEMPPIWSCSYTLNVNTQMNYWPVLSCNLTEFNEPLIEMIRQLSQAGQTTAQNLYHADGWTVHQITDIWRMTNPSGGYYVPDSCCYAFWNGGSGWLCRHLMDHYEYTLDTDYLRNTAYPIIKEAAKFYLSLLKEYHGKLILTPTTSPENHFRANGEVYSVSRYCAMSQAIVKDVLDMVSRSCGILDIDAEFAETAEKTADRLMMFQVGSQGQLLEWNEEYEEADPDFYHLSPLYGLFPANQIAKKDESIYPAAVKFLKRHSLKAVWPGSWQWNLYDKIGDADAVLNLIQKLTHRPNGGSLLDYCIPFQVDWIFGNMAGIANMFLMSEPGELYIFQAVPDLFKEGHFCGLKAKGNIEVDLYWNQVQTEIRLRTAYAQTVRLYFRNSYEQTLDLTANEEQVIILS